MKCNWQSEEQADLECERGKESQFPVWMYSLLNDSDFNYGTNEQGRKKSILKFEGDVIFCDLNM